MARKAKTSGPSAAQVARDAGCSRVLAARLLKRGFTPGEICKRVEERKQRESAQRSAAPPVNGYPSFALSQARKEHALARLRELQADAVARAMIPREQAKTWLSHILVPLANSLRRLPGELAPEVAEISQPAEIERLLSERIEGCLLCCREYWRAISDRGQPLGDGVLNVGKGYGIKWEIVLLPQKKTA
jgi:hypothetical protein